MYYLLQARDLNALKAVVPRDVTGNAKETQQYHMRKTSITVPVHTVFHLM